MIMDNINIEYLKKILNFDNKKLLQLMLKINSEKKDNIITFSKNVFIPITPICRNNCGYCGFKKDPKEYKGKLIMDLDEILDKIKLSDTLGCKEALFTFGEGADEVFEVKELINTMGFSSVSDYLYYVCEKTLAETNLLPHSNLGVITKNELKKLKEVNVSMGLMLENSSSRLMNTVAHKNSPGKDPSLRLKTIKNAGKLRIPFTTGILVGIGETWDERLESLLELRKIQDKYGNIQEIIIQNFKPKMNTRMCDYPEPSFLEVLKSVLIAKIIFPDTSIQIPPNLNLESIQFFLLGGCDDLGGVSPLTKDYVNIGYSWPGLNELNGLVKELGFIMEERLPVYDKYINSEFLNPSLLSKISSIYG